MGANFCGVTEHSDAVKDAESKALNRSTSPKKSKKKNANSDDMKYDDSLPLPGISLIENTFDLQHDLQLLEAKYKSQFAPLLQRKMVDIKKAEHDSITVMQFNMLADGLSTSYTMKETEKTFLNVDKECLQWTYRGVRIVEEILRYNPDVIAIQECDQIEFIMKYLSRKGYAYVFAEKKTSAIPKINEQLMNERRGQSFTMNKDGCALIYRTSLCDIVNKSEIQRVDGAQNNAKVNGLAVPLRIKNEEILFIVTHLKSTKSKEGEQLRVKQINLLVKELVPNEKKLPIILCCDLNANPVVNQKGYEPMCYQAVTDGLGFESVYKLANGTEPEYTTCKARKDGINKHVLDYIFIKDGQWNVTQVLSIPEMDDNKLIPNWSYPSDHFSIAAQLTWTN